MPTFEIESGYGGLVLGTDEAGRGCLAGPVVAAAAWLDRDRFPKELLAQINDSKKLSKLKRERIYEAMRTLPSDIFAYAFARIEAAEIDEINILQASLKAMKQAIEKTGINAEICLIDGNKVPAGVNGLAVVKGDSKSLSIAAASIIAKCEKDKALDEIAREFPQYGFTKNAGYGTAEHLAALQQFGACREHRKTYAPVAQIGRFFIG